MVAFAAAAAPNSLRALASDFVAFEAWCRAAGGPALPAVPATVADYLRARDAGGAAPGLARALQGVDLARVHVLARLADPTRDPLVTLTLRAIRRARGTAQKQARPLRFKGAVKDVRVDMPRGLSLAAMLDGCGTSAIGLRDTALLSVAYDTGLRAAELVALAVEDLVAAIDADAGLIIGTPDQERSGRGGGDRVPVTALDAERCGFGLKRPRSRRDRCSDGCSSGACRLGLQSPVPGGRGSRAANCGWAGMPTYLRSPAHTRYTVGGEALTPAAVTGVYRRAMLRAFAAGSLPDLDAREFAAWVAGVSAHSTRVGLTQDLFSAGEDLAGIMDALRWKTPRMPLLYNRNLAAESGAAGRVVSRLVGAIRLTSSGVLFAVTDTYIPVI